MIKKLGAMLGTNGWDIEDLQDAIAFLFSGSPMIRGIFDKEMGKLTHDQDIFSNRLDFIQDISQYIEDLPESSEE